MKNMRDSWRGALFLLVLPLLGAGVSFARQTPTQSAQSSGPGQSPAEVSPSWSSRQIPPASTAAQPGERNALQSSKDLDGTYTIRENVPLVVLDVVVTDGKDKPVRDLQQRDFQVQEAGETQTILNFEEAGAHVPDASVTIDSTANLDRLAPSAPVQIIVLDEFNTRFEDMAFARYSLKKFLEKQPAKLSTPTILIAVDLRHFTVVHDYTQRKDELIKALDHHLAAYPWQAHQYAWFAERYATAFVTLRRVAQAVMGHPGHKNMVWIGRGFPPFNFADTPAAAQDELNTAVRECVNVLRAARITLYTIDPAGLMIDRGTYGSAAELNDPFGGDYQFTKLARATGGTSLYGRNDVDAEIGTAIQDGSSFYTLTYRPMNASQDPQKFRKIKVTLERPDLKVLTREGYYVQNGPGRVDPETPSRWLRADLLAADKSRMAYDGVPMTVVPSAKGPGAFIVHLDARGLTWTAATDTEGRHADFILIVSTFDKKGKELNRDAKTYKIAAQGEIPPMGRLERAVNMDYQVAWDAKAVRARFTVRVTASGRIGALDVDLRSM